MCAEQFFAVAFPSSTYVGFHYIMHCHERGLRTGVKCGQGSSVDRGQVWTGVKCGQGSSVDRGQVRTSETDKPVQGAQ